MIGLLLAAIGTASILLIGELLWKDKIIKGENARKLIHIIACFYAAFWPFFMDRYQIVILSGIFVLAIIVCKKLHIFNSMNGSRRKTYGEICFALSIGAMALIFKEVLYLYDCHVTYGAGRWFCGNCGSSFGKRSQKLLF